MRVAHYLVAWILPRTHEQSRAKRFSCDHEIVNSRAGTAADKVDDFQFIALRDDNALPSRLRNDGAIALDSNEFFRETQKVQELNHAARRGKRLRFPVDTNL